MFNRRSSRNRRIRSNSRRRRAAPGCRQGSAIAEADCIDLTGSDDDTLINLTSSGSNDHSVIVLDSPVDSPPSRRRRRSVRGRARIPQPDVISSSPDSSPTHNGVQDTTGERFRFPSPENLNDDSLELPPISFSCNITAPSAQPSTVSKVGQSTSAETVSSPGLILTCPICLDTHKEIQRSGRHISSTTCGHIFCDVCIKNYVKSSSTCPVCRKKKIKIHTLHL